MKKYFEILRQCPLFDQIRGEDLLPMLGCLGARAASFEKKDTVLAEGTPAQFIGVVLAGSLQIEQTDYYGNRSILGNVGPGEIFGESFACAEVGAIPVAVVANGPAEVMLLDCRRILHACSNSCGFHHRLIFNLMKDLATKNLRFHQKVEVTGRRSTREKLMAYLMLQAKRVGSSSFEIPFDRQQLADYLEVDRSGLSAVISKLRREGVLESNKNHFKLH